MTGKHVVLAEYFMTDDALLLFVMRDDFAEPEVVPIERTPKQIQDFVLQNFQPEIDSEGHLLKSTGGKVRALDEDAFQDFFAPLVAPLVAQSVTGGRRSNEGDFIWLVPYDVLHYLPLHALKVEGRHLIERNPVLYTPSASVMKYCQSNRRNRRNQALVVGDSLNDLPHAREEAAMVANLFATQPYLGQQATKSAVIEFIKRKNESLDILHFSCHGYFDSNEPLNSGIKLAPEPPDSDQPLDQRQLNLTAEEIFQLEINADLVTLSACESGVSAQRRGDELIGLTRALIHAGIPSVVVSLWTVNDTSTALLMREFYNGLRKPNERGEFLTKAEALQAAQKYLIDLTAKDGIHYCEERLSQLNNTTEWRQVIRYRMDVANFQILAGDLRSAIARYKELREQLAEAREEWAVDIVAQINRKLPALEIKAVDALPEINFGVHPYRRIYYWAPFVLVGDWK